MEPATTLTAATAFAGLAREFCDWCEAPSPDADAATRAAHLIARLHAAAMLLPETSADNDDQDEPEAPEDSLARARARLGAFNGWYYREVFDPDPRLSDAPGVGDVGDDLLDIYLDLRRGLVLFDRGRELDALWHWPFLHTIHWGRHAVGAMFALHCRRVAKTS